jgi:LytS/YehU family sensor histidine kinase
LQTQAENAIKHGISKIVEGGKIVISTKKVNEYWIELTILNSGELGYQVDTGIGIENSKRRLDLQYNGNTLFELFQNKDEVVCSIKIKL